MLHVWHSLVEAATTLHTHSPAVATLGLHHRLPPNSCGWMSAPVWAVVNNIATNISLRPATLGQPSCAVVFFKKMDSL